MFGLMLVKVNGSIFDYLEKSITNFLFFNDQGYSNVIKPLGLLVIVPVKNPKTCSFLILTEVKTPKSYASSSNYKYKKLGI